MSVEYACVYVLYVLSWAGRQAQMDPTRGSTGEIRFRSGPMAHSVILSSAHFLTSCLLTLGRLPGDPVVCGPVDFLRLA